ncbi:type VII secretion target [Nocardia sp. NBC_01329]|uniref:type VII secretion target n=1 Tax=Nocardia sp. NBC_01329 TaxID=2903594 RepID=UPI002E13FC11|nr:type VII secretion target [Nocardia sp. NBC_01329]
MTDNPDSVSVDPEEVRNHAGNVQALMGSLDKSLEAANYLASADDGYGAWLQPLMAWLFEDNHQSIVELIRAAGERAAQVPEKLKATATSFEDADGSFATTLQGLQATIGEPR